MSDKAESPKSSSSFIFLVVSIVVLIVVIIAVAIFATKRTERIMRDKELNLGVTSLLNGGSIDDVEKLVQKYHFTSEELEAPCTYAISSRIKHDGCSAETKQLVEYCRIKNDTYAETVKSVREGMHIDEDYPAELQLVERCQSFLGNPDESLIRAALGRYLDNLQGKEALSVAEQYGLKESIEYAAQIYVVNLLRSCCEGVWLGCTKEYSTCILQHKECVKIADINAQTALIVISRCGLDRREIIDAISLVAGGASINTALLIAGAVAEK